MAHDIFISYSSDDKTVADAVCNGLETKGIRCWMAPRDVGPGQEWAASIVDGIEDCSIFVIILSSGANKSSQVLREVERAVNAGKIVIPFRIESLMLSKSLGYFLSVPHWLDAITAPLENHINKLAVVIDNLLKGKDPDAIEATDATDARGDWESPSVLSRTTVYARTALHDKNKLYIIISVLLTIVVIGMGWFFFSDRNHSIPVPQQQMMDFGPSRGMSH